MADIDYSVPKSKPQRRLTRQQLLQVLEEAGIEVEDRGVASTSPVVIWEIGAERDEIIYCQERDGMIGFVWLENPPESLETKLDRVFRKLGWRAGGD